jgi:hypothetical protein
MRRSTIHLGLLVTTLLCQSSASAEEAVSTDEPKVVARVGDEPILEKDVVPFVDQAILEFEQKEKIPADHYDKVRNKLIEDRINHLIEIRLVLLDVRKQISSEQLDKIEAAASEEFESKEIPKKIRALGLQSRDELVAITAKGPTSLDDQKQTYIETAITLSWVGEHAKRHKRPTTEMESLRNKVALQDYLAHLREQYPVKMLTDE